MPVKLKEIEELENDIREYYENDQWGYFYRMAKFLTDKGYSKNKEVSLTLDREKLIKVLMEAQRSSFYDVNIVYFGNVADAIIANQKELFKVVK